MKKTFAAALLAVTCAFSTSAFALPMEMTNAFSLGKYSNGTYTATYSGTTFLPANYKVNSLSFAFSFLDDGSDSYTKSTVTSTAAGAYKAHPWGSNWKYREVAVTNTTTKTYEQETATVSIGDVVLGTGSTTLDSKTETTGAGAYWNFDGVECSKTRTAKHCTLNKSLVTTTNVKITNDYKGSFTFDGVISNQSVIDQLLNNDLLTLTLNVGGDLKLTNAQVFVDYSIVELPAEVPEPSSMLLGAAGLAAIGFIRRRRGAAKA